MKEAIIKSPVDGVVKNIEQVDDPVFAQKIMGEGVAVIPKNGNFVSPIDGEILVAFPTGHAFGIKHHEGFEVLIHIGIDTINLKGEGFLIKSKQGQTLSVGDKLVNVDLDVLKSNNVSTDTMIIFPTSSFDGWKIVEIASGSIKVGDQLIKLIKE